MVEMTQLKPFGRRRKTYFYGVAGFVLAAHVVVGGIIYVMPKALDGAAPKLVTMEMQVVDYVIPAEAIETGAVQLIEQAEEPPISFEPAWDATATVAPEIEPIGPTASELPEMAVADTADLVEEVKSDVVEPVPAATEPKVVVTPPAPKTKYVPKKASTPTQRVRSSSGSTKKKTQRRTVTRTAPKPQPKPKKKYTPPPPPRPIPRAVPTGRSLEKKGLLDRLKDRRSR